MQKRCMIVTSPTTKKKKSNFKDLFAWKVAGGGGGGGGGCEHTPLAGQIISKSCNFSPETEFKPLILASTQSQNFLKIRTPLCKNP